MSDEKEDKESIATTAIQIIKGEPLIKGEPRHLPSRLGLARIMGATVGALLAAALYSIPNMPPLAAIFIFAAFTLAGREIGAWLALKKLSSDPYSISDWDHARIMTSRLIEMGVKPELARQEAARIVSEAEDLDDLSSIGYVLQQLPEHVFVQPNNESSKAIDSESTNLLT